MNPKEKITLTKEQETLLIPLYAKAQKNPLLQDEKAAQILQAVAYDFAGLKVPEKTAVTLRIRARQLDEITHQFLAKHRQALVLHLGCGLDSRVLRVQASAHPEVQWYDLDLPDVIALRRKFYPETGQYHLIGSSVTDLTWVEQIQAQGRRALVIAEGLLMYLTESQVRDLVVCLHERFPGGELAFDAFSRLTADRIGAHPSLKQTGAVVRWGIDDPHTIETWAEGIRLKEEWFFSQSPDLEQLNWFYRSMFRLAARFPAAQRAQRLLHYQL